MRERLSLRPLADGDILRLREILTESAVARWWPPDALDGWESSDDVTRMSICVEDRVSGLIQYHEADDPRYRHAGIDLFLDHRASRSRPRERRRSGSSHAICSRSGATTGW